MYQYDDYDRALVFERVAQFRDQVERFMTGELSEEEFLPLRLQNGLYMQKHAYMLRVAIPYGTLSARQLRTLARQASRPASSHIPAKRARLCLPPNGTGADALSS